VALSGTHESPFSWSNAVATVVNTVSKHFFQNPDALWQKLQLKATSDVHTSMANSPWAPVRTQHRKEAMSDTIINVLDILFILQTEAIYDEDMGA
jgi:hypothetical protein